MAVTEGQATLTSGQFTSLATARFKRIHVVLTAISNAEFTTIPFRVKVRATTRDFDASEVKLNLFQAFPSVEILATAPAGVATVDISFEVRTGADF